MFSCHVIECEDSGSKTGICSRGIFIFWGETMVVGVEGGSFALTSSLWRFLFIRYAMRGGSWKRCPNVLSSWR